MFDWAREAAGLTDKHHGSAACHTVKQQTAETPFTELTKEDLRWEVINDTSVESKTFNITTHAGRLAIVQITLSNVLNVKTTAQINVKLFSEDGSIPHLWNSDIVSKFEFSNDKYDFISEKVSLKLSADGKSYVVKSSHNSACTVDLTLTQIAPGFMAGKNGTTVFGEDLKKPYGKMKHMFWPRMQVEGTLTTKDGRQDMTGTGSYVHAVQGVKPHFAAAKWEFVQFQSPNYSAISMEFITPPTYDKTVVSVGGVAKNEEIIIANANSTATHVSSIYDRESRMSEPKAVKYTWSGTSGDGKQISAEIEAVFPEQRLDRIDIMAEVPKLLKGIVTGATKIKPYIFQNAAKAKLIITVDDEVKEEEGILFCEATFLS